MRFYSIIYITYFPGFVHHYIQTKSVIALFTNSFNTFLIPHKRKLEPVFSVSDIPV
jgi:hypothetical protein